MELRECLGRASSEQLTRIAAQLGLEPGQDRSPVERTAATLLLDPASLQAHLANLSDEGWAALKVVFYNGGEPGITVELCHQIVNLLSGKRRKSSARALEELQEHGLIFVRTANYRQLFFIPFDLLQVLTPILNQELVAKVGVIDRPVRSVALERDLMEDLHRFLAYLYTHEVTLTHQGLIYKRHLRALLDLLHTGDEADSLVGRYPEPLGLLVGYAMDRRLALRSDSVLGVTDGLDSWLGNPTHAKQEDLFHYWQDRYYYQDLQTFLSVISIMGERWVSLSALVAELEPRINPSQRGSFLVRLKHHLNTFLGPMGLLELGESEGEPEPLCRLTPAGRVIIGSEKLPLEDEPAQNQFFLQATFELIAPRPVPPKVIWMLELMADLVGRTDRTLTYALSRPSVYRGLQQGVSGPEMIRFLAATSATPVPQNVEHELSAWAASYGQVFLQQVTLLRCADPMLALQVKASRRTAKYVLGELSPTDLIVDGDQYRQLLEGLVQDGLMPRPGVQGPPQPEREE